MQLDKRTQTKLNNFVRTLWQSNVLDWVKKLNKKFPDAEIYLVGGAVRDAVLNKPTKDFDFVVRNVSMQDLEKFLSALGWVEKLGKNFGVLKFKPKKKIVNELLLHLQGKKKDDEFKFEPLDIALPRQEISLTPGSYRDFEVKFDEKIAIQDDLLRRDFTVNAMALKLTPPSPPFARVGTLIDPFNGLKDLKAKKIRCVGKAQERLSEDYTRILRAVRFACQLDFEIEGSTLKSIKQLVKHLNDKNKKNEFVSAREIIAKEFLKALFENPIRTVELYDKLGIFKVLMPEVLKMKKCEQPENFHTEGDVWQHTMLCLKNLASPEFKSFEKRLMRLLPAEQEFDQREKMELILGLFLHDIGKPVTKQTPEKDGVDRVRFNNHDNAGANLATEICQRLKLSSPEKLGVDCENVQLIIRKHMMLLQGHPSEFKPTTIEKYFFSHLFPGHNLIRLAFVDSLSTITESGKLDQDLIGALLKRIKQMKSLVKSKKAKEALPQPLLNGNEIMKILKIKSGKRIGEIKDLLREQQLTGILKTKKQAQKFVKDIRK